MNRRFVSCRIDAPWSINPRLDSIGPREAQSGDAPKPFISASEATVLLNSDLAAAEARARSALELDPGDPQARYLLGAALRRQGHSQAAIAILEPLTASQPHMQFAWHELGLALANLDLRIAATDALLRAIDLSYLDEDAWYALGFLMFPDRREKREDPHSEQQLVEAENAVLNVRFEVAERILRQRVGAEPDDAEVLKLLADTLLRLGRWKDARPLLERCLDLNPDFLAARFRYATMLFAHSEYLPALPQIEKLLQLHPNNSLYRGLKALALSWSRQFDAAEAEFEAFIDDCPQRPGLWLEYARLLRAMRNERSVAAYRRAIEILPSYVDAYVALAGLKTFRLDDLFVGQVEALLARSELAAEDRAQLHFVLGKALEDLGRYADSFAHYGSSNRILLYTRKYGVEASTMSMKRAKTFFTPAFFRERAAFGCPDSGAIFVVGMPRAGSTLVEQILSSHSAIEALGELKDLLDVAREFLPDQEGGSPVPYPFSLKNLDRNRFRLMGESYMERTRGRRKLDKQFFVDKLPSNHTLVGLIHLILPNALIIDARRHPLDCGLSCYKHYFSAGQPLSLDLRDIGRSYANYVEVMAHYDHVLPGRVHRVIYERLISNFETEVRRLLNYVGVRFEEQCLRFYENRRLVLTLSADQVGMPLYKTAVQHWRHYDPWLGPLKEELGYVLDIYPEVPKFYADVHAKWSKPLRLGFGANLFGMVKGVRQVPFEIVRQPSMSLASP